MKPVSPIVGDRSASGASIEVDCVTKQFGSHLAVQTASFSLAPGTLSTLLGPSGSGKTTILKMIAGFETPSSGRVRISARDMTDVAPHKRDIGFVFQQYALFPHLTVAENIAYPLKMRGIRAPERSDRVDEALALVRLTGMNSRYPRELSGGQQQRIAIARAIVFRPALLLMDEPMAALDKRLRDEMQYELRGLQKTLGITTIVVTHDQTEALVMSDQMIVLNRGSVEQMGSPQEVYGQPCNEFVASFIGEANLLKGVIESDSEGHWFRQSPSTRFPLPTLAPTQSDAAATYVVRPEVVTLSGAPTKDTVRLEGRVVEVGFIGDAVRLKVDLGLPEPMIAKLLNKPGEIPPREGDQVALAWATKDANVIQH